MVSVLRNLAEKSLQNSIGGGSGGRAGGLQPAFFLGGGAFLRGGTVRHTTVEQYSR